METVKKPQNVQNVKKDNWTEQKGKLKAKFPKLTDADLQFEQGKKEDMLKKVQTKLGVTKEELSKVIGI